MEDHKYDESDEEELVTDDKESKEEEGKDVDFNVPD